MDHEPNALSLAFVEQLYIQYLQDRNSVSAEWQRYFDQMDSDGRFESTARAEPSFTPSSVFNPGPQSDGRFSAEGLTASQTMALKLQERVDQMIRAYRVRGHTIAKVDPLGRVGEADAELDLGHYGFSDSDMDKIFSAESIYGPNKLTLREVFERLHNTYCRSIGVQYMHIDNIRVRRWLQERMEGTENRLKLERDEQLRILTSLTDAILFEEFVQKKFLGAKSFSLEGAESLIPLLEIAIEKAGSLGVKEIVLGMAHRGRLNVLANIMGKSPRLIFREFEDTATTGQRGGGDVKYHLGYSRDWQTASGENVHLSLAFNPSHLEFINPVAIGRMRAKQDRVGDVHRELGLPILIHGDAAFAGEGVVQETLNMSGLPNYAVGGTLHVIVNNQIGFTTSPEEGRTSRYATDVARMLQIPIFHVNGEDPEAVAQVIRLALDFRQTFKRDVVVDMYCFRRRGHNEGDEPAFTQPVLYKAVRARKHVRQGYLEHLLKLGEVTREEADQIVEERSARLEEELSHARSTEEQPDDRQSPMRGLWSDYQGGPDGEVPEVPTGYDESKLRELLRKQTTVPDDFKPHKKIERLLKNRLKMVDGEKPLDWAAAESLAFATIAVEGHRVRISGQDVGRGTFSHRHAVLHDEETGATYVPLNHLSDEQAPVELLNSPLSENGVLGFEYGYSLDWPDGLIGWEAQFGDFANAGQVIIDQFIAAAETKWQRLSGLLMLLPHGFEGQGPEHSSARLERFLALAACDNFQVCNLTTPAQLFHCLRRQVLRSWRKPLVIMSPKSLLRAPQVTSSFKELAEGRFQRILPDQRRIAGPKVKRVLLCSGKVYYDLDAHREAEGRDDVAILRFEQIYPLSDEAISMALAPYNDKTPMYWVQEEPANMGAWPHLRARFGDSIFGRWPLGVVSRPASPSPGTGSMRWHKLEQEELIQSAYSAPAPRKRASKPARTQPEVQKTEEAK